MDEIHNQQKHAPQLTYTRVRQTAEFTYSVYRCGGCGENVTTDNLAEHAAKQHNTYDWVKGGDSA